MAAIWFSGQFQGDEATDADRLTNDEVLAGGLLEGELLERVQRIHDVAHAGRRLCGVGEADGRAHLLGHGRRDIAHPRLIRSEQLLEHLDAFLARRLREGLEGLLGCRYGAIDVFGRAHGDLADGLFRCRIDDVQRLLADRVDPLAVDVELQCVIHAAVLSL